MRRQTEAKTLFDMAEAEVRRTRCARVLRLPAGGGLHRYDLGLPQFHLASSLPAQLPRVLSMNYNQPGVLYVHATPSRDGTDSLHCLNGVAQ